MIKVYRVWGLGFLGFRVRIAMVKGFGFRVQSALNLRKYGFVVYYGHAGYFISAVTTGWLRSSSEGFAVSGFIDCSFSVKGSGCYPVFLLCCCMEGAI